MARPLKDHKEYPCLAAFGQSIKSLRLEKGISQEELSELAKIDRSYMGGIERGEHNISLINVQKIALALDTPIAALMTKAEL